MIQKRIVPRMTFLAVTKIKIGQLLNHVVQDFVVDQQGLNMVVAAIGDRVKIQTNLIQFYIFNQEN